SHALHRQGGSVLLQAAAASAATNGTVSVNVDVSQLAGHAQHAVPDAAIEHQAAADSGAQGDYAHVLDLSGRPQPLFAQGRGIGVVFEDHGGGEPALDLL